MLLSIPHLSIFIDTHIHLQMTYSANSTPSIDNDSSNRFTHASIPYSNPSATNRQGSISTLWSSAELPFFLDSRTYHSPNSNQISRDSHVHASGSSDDSRRPSISGSFSSSNINYALDRDRYGLGLPVGLGPGSSSSSGRPSISSEFGLGSGSRKDSRGSNIELGDNDDRGGTQEGLEELDDAQLHEPQRERRTSPSSYKMQIHSRSTEREKEGDFCMQDHPYPFSGPDSSFTDLDSSRDRQSSSSSFTSSSSPSKSRNISTFKSQKTLSPIKPGSQTSQFHREHNPTSSSSSSSIHDIPSRSRTNNLNHDSFSSNSDPLKKERELTGYQKRRPDHLGLSLPSSSSASLPRQPSSASTSSSPENADNHSKVSPRRDITAPSMPISVSYGSQLSSVYGLNSSKDGHSPSFPNYDSEPVPPIPTSSLQFPKHDNELQRLSKYSESTYDHGLKVPGLEHDASGVDGDFARSSTSGSTLTSPITPLTSLPSVVPTVSHHSEVFEAALLNLVMHQSALI